MRRVLIILAALASIVYAAGNYGNGRPEPVVTIDYNTNTVTVQAEGQRLLVQVAHIANSLERKVCNSLQDSTHVVTLPLPSKPGAFSVDVETFGSRGRRQTWFQGVMQADTLVEKK